MQFVHDSLYRGFNFFDFSIQLSNEADGVLQFQGLGRHPGANGASGGIPDLCSLIPPIAASGGIHQQGLQSGQVRGGNLFVSRELGQLRLNRRHM